LLLILKNLSGKKRTTYIMKNNNLCENSLFVLKTEKSPVSKSFRSMFGWN